MSEDEARFSKSEEKDEDVEAHVRISQRPQESDDEDTPDVEAHARVAQRPQESDDEDTPDVEAHMRPQTVRPQKPREA